jgi:hypothetical protein
VNARTDAEMICLDCARRSSLYKQHVKPIAVTETRCMVCHKVKGCVPKDHVHVTPRRLDAGAVFGWIEAEIRENAQAEPDLEVAERRKGIRPVE